MSEWLQPPNVSSSSLLKQAKSRRMPHHRQLGEQLGAGPLLLDVAGNPLGMAGMRQVLHALDSMSIMVEDAAAQASRPTPHGGRGESVPDADVDELGELLLPPWPLHVVVRSCNVDIADAPPEGSVMEGMDVHSPNPFLPSLFMATQAKAGGGGGAQGGGVKAKKVWDVWCAWLEGREGGSKRCWPHSCGATP